MTGTSRAGAALSGTEVRHAVARVLREEAATAAAMSVTFVTAQEMRALNRRHFQRDRATDVIAFPLMHGEAHVGDIYVCPPFVRRSAREHGVSQREEELRVVIHGTLHALGHDHAPGTRRTRSPMWERQERYLAQVLTGLRP